MISNIQQAFLELVRAGLWADTVSTNFSIQGFKDSEDWEKVYQLAEEQSVVGLVLAGIERYKNLNANLNLNQEVLLQWIGEVQILEQQNKAMNDFVAQLNKRLWHNKIYGLLVKGQGVAQCYERPLWRACGDVDLFLSDSDYDKAKEYLLQFASSKEPEAESTKHLGMTINSWVVELHGTMRSRVLSRMDKVIDEVKKDVFCGGNVRSWINGKTTVFLPSADNDIILVFTHILKHFFRGGIGLRQICDWCRLLWTYRDTIDRKLLKMRITRAGIMTEWKAFAAFAVDYLGMPTDALPLYSSDKRWSKKAQLIKKFILHVGNFGHNRDMSYYTEKPFFIRKIYSLWRQTTDGMKRFLIFPIDSVIVWFRMITGGISAVLKSFY